MRKLQSLTRPGVSAGLAWSKVARNASQMALTTVLNAGQAMCLMGLFADLIFIAHGLQ
jgi:hypothetical protein